MSNIPLDLERRCEQRWAARFEAARILQEQHRLEKQKQPLTALDNSERESGRVKSAGLRPASAERGTVARARLSMPFGYYLRRPFRLLP